ncbi:MAG: hypothetical protein K5643_01845 [Saccharofermentans sp.]|nr:hypothetical protein [Saccharofermentans sp.]
MKRKTKILILTILAISAISFIVYVYIGLTKYILSTDGVLHGEMSEEEKEQYSCMALLPDLKDYCVRYKIYYYENTNEGKINRINVECVSADKIPDKYQEAVNKALESEDYVDDFDFYGEGIDIYSIDSGLPFASPDDLTPDAREMADRVTERYYLVWLYPDGTKKLSFWFTYK